MWGGEGGENGENGGEGEEGEIEKDRERTKRKREDRKGPYIFFMEQSEAIFKRLSRAARMWGGNLRSVSIISGYSSMYKSSEIKPSAQVNG